MSRFKTFRALPAFRIGGLIFAVLCFFAVRTSDAVQVVFQLQGTNSLPSSPWVDAVASPMLAQDPGGASLTTTYTGTITVDVDNVMNPTTITFVSAAAAAANTGNWLPGIGGGTEGDPGILGDADPGVAAPANYGYVLDYFGLALLYGASRDTVFSLDAPAQAVTAGQFDPAPLHITVIQGTFDSNLSSTVFGDQAVQYDLSTGYDANNCAVKVETNNNGCGGAKGTYSVTGNVATLTFPLDYHIGGGTPVVGYTGTFTATASLVQGVTGDYNDDGTVDAADYVIYRDNVGTSNVLPNDPIGGTIGVAQYNQWRGAFGNTAGSGLGAGAVPEPVTAIMAVLGIAGLCLTRARRS